MSNESSLSLAELNDRIRILEDNIRQLIEQAAAASGERNESRIADRLSQQNEELERLTRERDARTKTKPLRAHTAIRWARLDLRKGLPLLGPHNNARPYGRRT
jgi:hypothetical protein